LGPKAQLFQQLQNLKALYMLCNFRTPGLTG
jgi:hypothetical protein